MIYRSRAPLRIGLAGGGTDVSPYMDQFGGCVVNATIDLYAHASLIPNNHNQITFEAPDKTLEFSFSADAKEVKNLPREFELFYGVYKHIVTAVGPLPGFQLSAYIEAPQGSGLGTSSTLVVALLGVFKEWLQLPWDRQRIAQIAFQIERVELGLAGGRQDQYASSYGGINFMTFNTDGSVKVEPLHLSSADTLELETCLLLYYTQIQRESAQIIRHQMESVKQGAAERIQAMHELKQQAIQLRTAFENGTFEVLGELLNFGWKQKKKMADQISNSYIDQLYSTALEAGAIGGKISGAGGGGFLFFYCPGITKLKVSQALRRFNGTVQHFTFSPQGLTTWRQNQNSI